MDFLVGFLFALIVMIISIQILKTWKTKLKVLPGPGLLEIIRGIIAQKNKIHLLFTDWSKIYGKIYAVTLGPLNIVILNDHKTIREAFTNPHFSGRAHIEPLNPLRLPRNGIVRNEGKNWALQRKITLTHLRRFGFAPGGLMERLIVEEIMDLIQDLRQNQNQAIHMNRHFFFPIMNMIWSVILGIRVTDAQDDQEIKKMVLDFFEDAEETTRNPLIILIPKFVDYWPWLPSWQKYAESAQKIEKFLKKHIEEHKRQILLNGVNEQPADFIYAYLQENCLEDFSNSKFNAKAEKQLEAILFDFFLAGFDTTSTQFDWVMYNLVTVDGIQKKIRAELDSIIGRHRLPNIGDRPRLPYTEACILESLRLTPIIPLGVMHRATADTTLFGYPIKNSSAIIGNTYGAQHDSDVIQEPNIFLPERFLKVDDITGVTCVNNQPYLMPFGCGSRMCIGDYVAKDTIFLMVATIFSKFHLRRVPTPKEITAKISNMVVIPPNFFVVVQERTMDSID